MSVWDGNRETTFAQGPTTLIDFNDAGAATITHNLGWVPAFIGLTHHSSVDGTGPIISLGVRHGSPTSTSFIVDARRHDGTLFTGGLRMSWFAAL